MVSWIVLLSVIVAFFWSYILLPNLNGTILAILNFHVAQISPSFGQIQHSADLVDYHHDIHLGYQKEAILAILNLNVTQMPHTKFYFNQPNGLRYIS